MKTPKYDPKMKVLLAFQALLMIAGLVVSVMRLISSVKLAMPPLLIATNVILFIDFLMIIAYALFHWEKHDGYFRAIIYAYTGMLVLTNLIYFRMSITSDTIVQGVGIHCMTSTVVFGLLLLFASYLSDEKRANHYLIFAVILTVADAVFSCVMFYSAHLAEGLSLPLISTYCANPVLLGTIGLAYHNRCYRKKNGL